MPEQAFHTTCRAFYCPTINSFKIAIKHFKCCGYRLNVVAGLVCAVRSDRKDIIDIDPLNGYGQGETSILPDLGI